jgi:hypothetical protein
MISIAIDRYIWSVKKHIPMTYIPMLVISDV